MFKANSDIIEKIIANGLTDDATQLDTERETGWRPIVDDITAAKA
jgi:hypothetical protein